MEFQNQPIIPTTGVYIENEPVRVTLTVKDGKVIDCSVDARGKGSGLVGPQGFYIKARAAWLKQQEPRSQHNPINSRAA